MGTETTVKLVELVEYDGWIWKEPGETTGYTAQHPLVKLWKEHQMMLEFIELCLELDLEPEKLSAMRRAITRYMSREADERV